MLDVRENMKEVEAEQASKARPARARGGRKASDSGRQSKDRGLRVEAVFSEAGVNPFDQLEWEQRRATIGDDKGNTIFVQDGVEVPKSWSMLATNVVASKYFFGPQDSDRREYSVRQLVERVARTLADAGRADGVFASEEDAEAFQQDLTYLCVNQYGSFNSPVWFNVGLHHVYGESSPCRSAYAWDSETQSIFQCDDSYKYPQGSACFIQSVSDTMEGIMHLATSEAMLFKYGSGTGTDLSTLRSSRERLSGGGTPSGPVSFMRVFDQVAAVIKSGGKTRRAAKMQSLKIHHPDIEEFIVCKMDEEKKAWALIEQGYDGSFGGEAYESVMFQNANTSVRVTDEFMQAVENDAEWQTKAVTTGETAETYSARDLMYKIAEGTHVCGDPGVQYDTTINRWHTCAQSGRINASNPCSEFMFLDNSACNLASLNLMKFVDEAGIFNVEMFKSACRIFIIAQEIIVDSASYPTAEIAENSHRFRPLGLGYANLGALIMRLGMAYDSDEGRAFAAAVTALMSGQAYLTSQELAQVKGSFDGFEANRECMLNVMQMHREAVNEIDDLPGQPHIKREADKLWQEVVDKGGKTGFRNSQVTLLAPTGTIGFMMDCDTTGVEPDIALVKYKQLAGGGTMKIVNRTLAPALRRLGYTSEAIRSIEAHVDVHETIEGAPGLKEDHLQVFDCAFQPRNGHRFIPYHAHLKMMAAVQPFLSGAISKTINMPAEATIEEIEQAYLDGWRLGLKAVAIYRDGSKRTQPLSTSLKKDGAEGKADLDVQTPVPVVEDRPFRRRMPETRQSITHKFEVAGHEGYMTVGMYEDGSPGEVFITMAKEGSTVGGTMDAFGTAISLCLQYGVPVTDICQKFAHSRFEPSGFTKNPDIPIAKSIVDYIFRWLNLTFPGGKMAGTHQSAPAALPAPIPAVQAQPATAPTPAVARAVAKQDDRVDQQFDHFMEDAPACDVCGAITVRNGACYRCYNCGNSMGCS